MNLLRDWKVKAAVQKGISLVPGGRNINYFLQRHVTKGARLNQQYIEDKLDHVRRHLSAWRDHAPESIDPPESALELGTGWFPVIPIAMRMAGCKQITTIDLDPHIRPDNVLLTIRKLLEYHESGRLTNWFQMQEDQLPKIKAALKSKDPLQALNIEYIVGDATALAGEDRFDLSLSNNVLEHVSAKVMDGILKRFAGLTRNDGIGSHFVDMSDHFAHFDSSISVYHFLRFSPGAWARIDNDLQPQNRLRLPHLRASFKRSGWEILEENRISAQPELLASEPVHEWYANVPAEELAVYHVQYVHRPLRG